MINLVVEMVYETKSRDIQKINILTMRLWKIDLMIVDIDEWWVEIFFKELIIWVPVFEHFENQYSIFDTTDASFEYLLKFLKQEYANERRKKTLLL